jgi:hypothetical protein
MEMSPEQKEVINNSIHDCVVRTKAYYERNTDSTLQKIVWMLEITRMFIDALTMFIDELGKLSNKVDEKVFWELRK